MPIHIERLKEQIDTLDAVEHAQIFAILKRHAREFTRTDMGVYVSLDKLSKECIEEITTYIDYCKIQKKHVEAETLRRRKYEQMLKRE